MKQTVEPQTIHSTDLGQLTGQFPELLLDFFRDAHIEHPCPSRP